MTPEYIDHQTAKKLFCISRSYLYTLANEGKINSISIRKNEDVKKGRRLFQTQSIRDYFATQLTHLNISTPKP